MFRNHSISELFLFIFERKLGLRLPISSRLRWKYNIGSEVRFWDKCIRTKGLIWQDEFRLRLDPNLKLQEEITRLLPDQNEISILDVGAGPLTYVGKVYDKAAIKITAVDPLAEEYDIILSKYSLVPLIRTEKLDAEELTKKFAENSFDIVFARNCIDHSYSPEAAILEMLKVVKENCYVLLLHRPNEAEQENWRGLHQWNFSTEDGDFFISSKNEKTNFSKKYSHLCQTKCSYDAADDMLYTQLLKMKN
jgi:SAM-dependent methyltransferase